MKRVLIIAIALTATVFCQGCAVFYATDTVEADGTTEREFGLLGGCLPLWRFESKRPVPEEKPEPGTKVPADRPKHHKNCDHD
ncbi:hypothetical protein BVX97_03355 [bacterium E08(2017)]|nr:hypothetical protein BVX97_03355 [bacterium E08(2017)]